VDKVACKRWFPTVGISIPKIYALYYADELTTAFGAKTREELIEAIGKLLPPHQEVDYVAKPTHKSLLQGNWLVHFDKEEGKTKFSRTARQLRSDEEEFRPLDVAKSLAEELGSPPDPIESWALKNVQPGFVLEERWKAHDDDDVPPHELNIFTIWGRVWVGQWNYVENQDRWCLGFIRRDGTFVPGSYNYGKELPAWIEWPELVRMAEWAGANKDMFRFDVFAGLPWTVPSLGETTVKQRERMVRIVASEQEVFPTTIFLDDALPEEAARMWIGGYKAGNYRVVPNREVPAEFLETGKFSPACLNPQRGQGGFGPSVGRYSGPS
jgi:hypothetical protein